ncbi:MAG: hypothetical protein KBG48_04605 [Kofleriaceae bacterium]|nr:hypothetical protein [Kofleriaceae bacterium]MBP9166641.1 hypothetical protein [Kofleriaceae bacterium]MBP9858439.1 hypothetical protein [Kofleriaceae bacterium]
MSQPKTSGAALTSLVLLSVWSAGCKGKTSSKEPGVAEARAPSTAPSPAPPPPPAPSPPAPPTPAPPTATVGADGRIELSSLGPTWQGLSVSAPAGATATTAGSAALISHGPRFAYLLSLDPPALFATLPPSLELKRLQGKLGGTMFFQRTINGVHAHGFFARPKVGDGGAMCVSAPVPFAKDELPPMIESCTSLTRR